MLREFARKSWPTDWESILREAIRKEGFSSVLTFLAVNPLSGFKELAIRLRGGVISYQVQIVYYKDAKEAGVFRDAAIGSFLRLFRDYVPQGWLTKSEPLLAGEVDLTVTWREHLVAADSSLGIVAKAITKDIFNAKPSQGWLPKDAHDPILC